MYRFDTPTARLRSVASIEGTSYLVLLFVAMPLKYLAGMPSAVMAVGWAHGVLFVALGLILLDTHRKQRWPLMRSAMVMVAAVVPFGPFFIDRTLREEAMQPVAAGESQTPK